MSIDEAFARRIRVATAIAQTKVGETSLLEYLTKSNDEETIIDCLLDGAKAVIKSYDGENTVRIDLSNAEVYVPANPRPAFPESSLPYNGTFLDISTDGKYTVGDKVATTDDRISHYTIAGFWLTASGKIESYIVNNEGQYTGWLNTSAKTMVIIKQ